MWAFSCCSEMLGEQNDVGYDGSVVKDAYTLYFVCRNRGLETRVPRLSQNLVWAWGALEWGQCRIR